MLCAPSAVNKLSKTATGSNNDQELVGPSTNHVTTLTANHSGMVIGQTFLPLRGSSTIKGTLGLGGKGLSFILKKVLV